MKIVVVEDNKEFNLLICESVNDIARKSCLKYQLLNFYDFNNKLREIIYSCDIKIYIVDLQLNFQSGYDICREIREGANDWNSIIIICSAYNQKEEIISLRLSVFTYISKHINFKDNLRISGNKAIQVLSRNKTITINRNTKISINDICYIEKIKRTKYCRIVTLDFKEYKIMKTIKMLQKELNFKQVKNYLLINDNNIRIIDKQEIIFINKISIKY